MKKYGKYEKRPEGVPEKQPKVKSMLLQTYFTSLLCLVLCVTMFFGTSYAWFTSEVTNEGNEIYIGTLDVDLLLGDKSLKDDTSIKVFDDKIRWEPGYTALRTLTVQNKGDLAFRYALKFIIEDNADSSELMKVAGLFDVWVYKGTYTKEPDDTFAVMTTKEGWKPVGTLAEVLEGKAVFEGSMSKDQVMNESQTKLDTKQSYTIALHMQENASADVMGKKIGLNVKLTAYQMSSEQDDFGNGGYDSSATPTWYVSNTDELLDTLSKAGQGDTIVMKAGTYTIAENEKLQITTNSLTLKGEGTNETIIETGKTSCSGQAALYISADNVTVSDLKIISEGDFAVRDGKDKTYSDIDAIKVSNSNNKEAIINNVTLRNLVIFSNGNGVNLHGVNNAVVDGVKVEKFGKCGFSLANAKGVKFTNCVTAELSAVWADIGCMYKANDEAYKNPCEFAFDDTNKFGNGAIYSERPESDGGMDTATYPADWTYLSQPGGDIVWALTNKSQGNAG